MLIIGSHSKFTGFIVQPSAFLILQILIQSHVDPWDLLPGVLAVPHSHSNPRWTRHHDSTFLHHAHSNPRTHHHHCLPIDSISNLLDDMCSMHDRPSRNSISIFLHGKCSMPFCVREPCNSMQLYGLNRDCTHNGLLLREPPAPCPPPPPSGLLPEQPAPLAALAALNSCLVNCLSDTLASPTRPHAQPPT